MSDMPRKYQELRRGLAARTATDRQFDALFAEPVRAVSKRFWTPLAVSARAAQVFAEHKSARVLDVGSGPGKFCLAVAAADPNLLLTGIEHRPHLVEAARSAAARLQLKNVEFQLGNVTNAQWQDFDGFYFYNPFGENFFGSEDRFDASVELSSERFIAEIVLVERALLAARVGTTVLTYHGFGGRIPRSYTLSTEESFGQNLLRVWRKETIGNATDGYWLELSDGGITETKFRNLSLSTVHGPS
jgi:predicted RNA methylase